MAKNQNISLNPTKINGLCNRLLCCLDYEDETYTLTFRETVEARLHCTSNTCDGCILHGERCRKTDLASAVNGWLERILDKLDNAGKKMDEITDREWIELLE